jgi:hypothetical protein
MRKRTTKDEQAALPEPVHLDYIAEQFVDIATLVPDPANARTHPESKASVEYKRVKIDELHEDPANARIHPENNLADIRASLKEFGQVEPLVVQKSSGKVIGGNGRLKVMRDLGWTECDVAYVDVSPAKQIALGLALNRAGEQAQWDEQQLKTLIDELDGDVGELDQMLTDLEEEIIKDEQKTELKKLDTKTPPRMAWVLIGVPLVKYDSINADIERIAKIPDVVIEMTTNDQEN